MTPPQAPANQRLWPLLGVILGPIVASVPVILLLFATLAFQKLSGDSLEDASRRTDELMWIGFLGIAMFILVPLGAGAFIFSVIRLARLRRQTPPKLPPIMPSAPG